MTQKAKESKLRRKNYYTKEYDRQATARYRLRNPNLHRIYTLKKYGLTIDDYEALLKEQKGVCAFCKGDSNDKNMHVDHDHSTGKVRGILCGKCNRGLGYLGDDPQRLQAGIDYLSSSTSRISAVNITSHMVTVTASTDST